jgi:hypothetical protein
LSLLAKLGHKPALAVLAGALFVVGLVVSLALRRAPAEPSPAAAAPPSAPALTAVLAPPAAPPAAAAAEPAADELVIETTHPAAVRPKAKPAVSAAPKAPQRTRVDNPGF